jgi:hypothetical protein
MNTILETGINVIGVQGINNMIRKHFIELNQRFLHPINRYFEKLIVGNSSEMTLSCIRAEPVIKPFRQDEFLENIESNIPSLPLVPKRSVSEFYKSFLVSCNFASWLKQRTNDVYKNWRARYLKILCTSNLKEWFESRKADSTVEGVELLLKYKYELNRFAPFFQLEDDVVKLGYLSIKPQISLEPEEIVPVSEFGVDLSTIQPTKRHFKSFTNPELSSSNGSNSDESKNITFNFGKNGSTFVEELKNASKGPRKFGIFGEFIPTIKEYEQLLSQFNLLLSLLPDDCLCSE